jgi:hypothetical protein
VLGAYREAHVCQDRGNADSSRVNLSSRIAGVLQFAVDTAKTLPGSQSAVAIAADVEREVIRAVRGHLAGVDTAELIEDVTVADVLEDESPSPEQVLRGLMERSMYDRPAESAAALHLALLGALLPDEARIFAAVSDGSRYPVIHVAEPGVVAPTDHLLRNASTVGRAAGVALPEKTPVYLVRMLTLGLVTMGPEDVGMRDEYEMLLTDGAVHAAITAGSRGLRPARVIRRTLGISDLGHEVWEAAK